jgi:hypothetical protein
MIGNWSCKFLFDGLYNTKLDAKVHQIFPDWVFVFEA